MEPSEPSTSAAADQEHGICLPTVGSMEEHDDGIQQDTDALDAMNSSEDSTEFEGSDEEESEGLPNSTPESFLPDDFREPLYDGANISVCATYCAIMEFASSSRLPYASIEKLLGLLRILCPPDSQLPSSMFKLKQFFRMFSSDYEKTEICSGCGQTLPADHTCPQGVKKNIIVHLPIQNSLQSFTQSKEMGRGGCRERGRERL